MNSNRTMDREKIRKDRAKKAVELAMGNRWEDAIAMNQSILKDFPEDLEAFNRLGKAFSELGRNNDAIESFEKALALSPHNSIARKNLDRLSRLRDAGESVTVSITGSKSVNRVFIEESGKSGVTLLLNLAVPKVLVKLAPGHIVHLKIEGNKLNVENSLGEPVGRVEPKLASRLVRLMNGGNEYEATITSTSVQDLRIMIRESYKHPSQANIVSFPLRSEGDYRVYMPSAGLTYEDNEPDSEALSGPMNKDWSDDDTEPGDDEAFTPVFSRMVNSGDDNSDDDYQ
jgi:hypothetical protein